ncbi:MULTISPECIES: type II toxin-antitoxin system RelE/ParE family toxin [unclassified Shinella]|uniref:type II toxin-antitoxin system RelE/ParE family toxin n=1 Tax=unclassified Shinella TaxID=2643062 RepID=UPI00225D537E|nr:MULTISPECIES: type II toxin-antitoxin system RelE/ParE family toxin [unclassified Shinella]MCO5136491.1 type II toxin-antitoxin system RelE/ParE family toxin [Shinella sp.]MDC7253832.1 type II toxin-antitoxin system RelE/ParE family toxin [Shinella sp. YE25]CAI0336481.1 Toxin [Rhizobiaceae bacterium]CAK7255016.1 Toxin [Shinella sp. WSC3-e]
MHAFRFTESAEKDVDAILAYTITTWGDAQAEAYIGGLYRVLDLLAERPALGRLRPELAPGLRSFPYREHLLFYMLFEDTVLVVRILAARQNTGTGLLER